ncbi:MAG: ion transporter, partial [Lachnospiraceae bacterium]
MAKYRRRIFEIISIGNQGDWISRAFDYCIVTAIILNITVLFLETFDSLKAYMPLFNGIEYATVLIFVIEYALRIYTAPELYDELPAWKARLRFLISFDGVVDLLTILPFFFLYGFSVFRILRVVRIFHLFRLNTNYDSFHVITSVLYRKRNQLISSIFILLVLLFASSLCMYSAEHEAQPELFQNAFSGIWYSLNTIFTVGYGDIYPITKVGRFMGAVITFLGVGAVAIPTGIISAGFVEEYQRMAKREDDDALRNAGKAGAVAVQPAAKTISEEKLRVVRATTLAEQAGAYYVRIEAMARQYHIKAEQEFDRYDRPNT